jgi:hypothetical protein
MLLKLLLWHRRLPQRRTRTLLKHQPHQLTMALDETWHINSNSSNSRLDRQWQAQHKVS